MDTKMLMLLQSPLFSLKGLLPLRGKLAKKGPLNGIQSKTYKEIQDDL